MQKLTAVIFEEQGWHIAQCLEIDVASQGNTPDEAFSNLQEAIQLHLQAPRTTQFSSPFASSAAVALSSHPAGSIQQWELMNA